MKSAIRNYALLFFGCVLFHLAGTWIVPLIDRDEPRFAEASREMIERGDYIVPYFNNHFRFDKPPLTYWAQAASYGIFGENDFAARFPSAIAAALTALSIFAWGSRLRIASASQARIGGNRVGWWAAIIFTLSLQIFLHAKAAVADMWLVLFATLAHWSGYELIQRPTSNVQRPTFNSEGVEAPVLSRNSGWSWWFIFYFSLAFAFLAKGPIGWTPLATIAATRLFLPESKLNRRFNFLPGFVVMLAVVSIWGIPALIRTHGEFFRIGIGRHVIGRSFGAMEGHGANSFGAYFLLLPFYFLTIFVSFFPWSIKLPWLARQLWQKRDRIDDYLLAGTAVIFIIFTLVKTKLPHYTLPAFPLLSILLARRWIDNEMPISFLKKLAVAMAGIYLAVALFIAPFTAQIFPSRELYRQAENDLGPEMEFGAVDFTEPSLVWYFRSTIKGFMTTLKTDNAAMFMEKPGARFVIIPTRLLGDVFPNPLTKWKTFSTRGFNIVKGKRVELTLILKPD